jgi:hypothetical protein
MLNISFGAEAVVAEAASRYGSGSTKMMQILADPALKYYLQVPIFAGNQNKII